MKHAYLTKEAIGSAYQLGGVTVTEVKELLADLDRCALRAKKLALLVAKESV